MKKLILFLICLPQLLLAQQTDLDQLDAFISNQVTEYQIPGLAIGIIKDGDVLFKKGYGVTNLAAPKPVSTQTIFPVLSTTKAFTAAAIGMLVDEGKLHWDDKVTQYLPDFQLSDPHITAELTISDILSHRSGLGTFDGDLLWYGSSYSRDEIVQKIRYFPVRNNFRTEYGYQNVMYLVAGLIVKKVSGMSWDEFIEERIFTPLSMASSSTSITKLTGEISYAYPHLADRPIALLNVDNIAPAGSINSTIDDMLNWLKLWVNKGKWKDHQLLSELTYETITSPKVSTSRSSNESYGYGWFISSENGIKSIGHNGGLPGYKSSIIIFPEIDVGIVMLTNEISYLPEELTGIIFDFLLDSEGVDWNEAENSLYFKSFNFSWDQERESILDMVSDYPNGVNRYLGLYEDDIYGQARIRENEGQLFLELLPSRELLSGNLGYVEDDRLRIVFHDKFINPGELIFTFDENNLAESFKIDLSSDDFHFEYLNFVKVDDLEE